MTDAVIVDRGYRTYDGPRLGRGEAIRAIVREGIRRILGLRRKARRKVFPWLLIGITLIAAAVFVGVHFVAGSIAAGIAEGLPRYGELFDFYSQISLLFAALAGPELLVPDRTQGVLSVYFSRPLRVGDYLSGKLLAFFFLSMSFFLVPQIVLHIGLASLSGEFFTYLGDNLDVLWKVPFAALVYFVVHASVSGAIAASIPRTGIAAGAFLGTMVILNGVARVLFESGVAGAKWFSLLALEQHPRVARDWIFDITTTDYILTDAGFEPWVALVAAGVVAVVGAGWVWGRYRRLA